MNKENWQIAVLFIGHSKTGKSTILKYLRQYFRLENVGILSNNIEKQWAMSSLVDDKYIIIGYEIKGDFKWDQAEFQQAAACEEILVATKHKNAFVTQINTPIMMAANEMIKCWRDNSGSLKRRLLIIPFSTFVSPEKVNPNLFSDLMKEFPLWIQKINRAYRDRTAKYKGKDIWTVVPDELRDANDSVMQTVHPLQHFFAQQTNIVYQFEEKDERGNKIQDAFYITLDEFREEFKKFCDNSGYDYRKIKWHSDFYKSVFDSKGIRLEKMEITVPGTKSKVLKNCIIGMKFADHIVLDNNQ